MLISHSHHQPALTISSSYYPSLTIIKHHNHTVLSHHGPSLYNHPSFVVHHYFAEWYQAPWFFPNYLHYHALTPWWYWWMMAPSHGWWLVTIEDGQWAAGSAKSAVIYHHEWTAINHNISPWSSQSDFYHDYGWQVTMINHPDALSAMTNHDMSS